MSISAMQEAKMRTTRTGCRDLLRRVLEPDDIEPAIAAIDVAVRGLAQLTIIGDGYQVPLVEELHARWRPTDRPLIMCDLRRGDSDATIRAPISISDPVVALDSARGGTLIVRSSHLHRMRPIVDGAWRQRDTCLVVLYSTRPDRGRVYDWNVKPRCIRVPPFASMRRVEMAGEFLLDAIQYLDALPGCAGPEDAAWIAGQATSFTELRALCYRVVALRRFGGVYKASVQLGMSSTSLSRWRVRHGVSTDGHYDSPRSIATSSSISR